MVFTLVVSIRGGNVINLIYDSEDHARSDSAELAIACESAAPLIVTLTDDFGTEAHLGVKDIAAHTLQNVSRVNDGAGELQLAAMRANGKLQNKAQHDPALKFALPPGQGRILS